MQWLEVTIRTASGGVELLCAELSEAGFDSLMIDDNAEFQEFSQSSPGIVSSFNVNGPKSQAG